MADTGRWVHATNAADFAWGGIFGWRDDASPTGWLSGVVVETDSRTLCVRVKDIRPGILAARRSTTQENTE